MRLAEIWRYPVKSMAGERLDGVSVDAKGLAGDRALAAYTADGHVGSNKITRRFRPVPGLRSHAARMEDGRTTIRAPGGESRAADDAEVDAWLSASLGQSVTLRPETDVPHQDAAPVHILSTASLRWAEARIVRALDAFAFRPNLLVEGNEPWPAEENWVGRTIAVGEAVRLRVVEPTVRCVMVNARADGADDPRVLRTLAYENDGCLGVYAEVLAGGVITFGDKIAFTD